MLSLLLSGGRCGTVRNDEDVQICSGGEVLAVASQGAKWTHLIGIHPPTPPPTVDLCTSFQKLPPYPEGPVSTRAILQQVYHKGM